MVAHLEEIIVNDISHKADRQNNAVREYGERSFQFEMDRQTLNTTLDTLLKVGVINYYEFDFEYTYNGRIIKTITVWMNNGVVVIAIN